MIYDYEVLSVKNEKVKLDQYKGKVLLIVNTATGCGFTPQYEGLQKLYEEYMEQGLEILDFPCNQFFQQAPGSNEELASFCQLKYHTTFETFAKIDVNGENADPLYQYLREAAPAAEESEESQGLYSLLEQNGFTTSGNEVKWNFTKFLVDREGNVVARFSPTCNPEIIKESIKYYL